MWRGNRKGVLAGLLSLSMIAAGVYGDCKEHYTYCNSWPCQQPPHGLWGASPCVSAGAWVMIYMTKCQTNITLQQTWTDSVDTGYQLYGLSFLCSSTDGQGTITLWFTDECGYLFCDLGNTGNCDSLFGDCGGTAVGQCPAE
jgi:hypothetical protein